MNVIVVGNGANLLEQHYNKLIDGHDIVIRLGAFQIKGFEKYVGEKTDIWANGVSTIKIWKLFSGVENQKLWILEPQDEETDNEYLKLWQSIKYNPPQFNKEEHVKRLNVLKEKNEIEFFNNSNLSNLLNELKIIKFQNEKTFTRPSLGLCAVYMAIQKYKQIKTIGFDNMTSGWYWDLEHGYWHGKHNSLMERMWFERTKKAGKIISYD